MSQIKLDRYALTRNDAHSMWPQLLPPILRLLCLIDLHRKEGFALVCVPCLMWHVNCAVTNVSSSLCHHFHIVFCCAAMVVTVVSVVRHSTFWLFSVTILELTCTQHVHTWQCECTYTLNILGVSEGVHKQTQHESNMTAQWCFWVELPPAQTVLDEWGCTQHLNLSPHNWHEWLNPVVTATFVTLTFDRWWPVSKTENLK